MASTLVEDSWQQYESRVLNALGGEMDEAALALMKHAFYFGVFGLSTVLHTVAEQTEDLEQVDTAIAMIREETLAFLEEHAVERH